MKTRSFFVTLFAAACSSLTAAPNLNSVNDAPLTRQLRLFPQEKIHLSTDRDDYRAGDTVFLRAHCIDAVSMRPAMASRYVYVELLPACGGEALRRIRIRSDDGLYAGYLPLPDTTAAGVYTLAAYTRYQLNQHDDYLFRKAIRVSTDTLPASSAQPEAVGFDVSFFPEGGYLIPGRACRVAFKAMGSDGRSVAVKGVVRDQYGKAVGSFRSRHAGMGSFELTSVPGRKYTAECSDARGRVKKFPLPAAGSEALVVRINDLDSLLEVSPVSARPLPAGLQLLVHCRGMQCYLAPWNPQSSRLLFRKRDLPGGLLQVLLMRNDSEILSERLVFNPGNVLARTEVRPQNPAVANRQCVVLDVDVEDESGRPLAGDFSVSVVDAQSAAVSSGADIYATLMLTSELRGTIEDAKSYFDPRNADRQAALDELLLTQGWRRYDIPAVLKGELQEPTVPVEKGRSLTGRIVKSGEGNYGLYMLQAKAPAYGFSKTVAVAEDGTFRIDGIELPDKAQVRLTVLYADAPVKDAKIELDTERYADLTALMPGAFPHDANVRNAHLRQWALARQRHPHAQPVETVHAAPDREALQRAAEPEEVPVGSVKKPKGKESHVWDAAAIREMGAYSVEDLIARIPGITVSEGVAMYRQRPVAFAVNGVIETAPEQIAASPQGVLGKLQDRPKPAEAIVYRSNPDYSTELIDQRRSFLSGGESVPNLPVSILTYPIEVVKQVELVQPGNTLQWGPEAVNGLLHFTIDHTMTARQADVPLPVAVPSPESGPTLELAGYQRPVEFYAPAYPTEESRLAERPDYRVTHYWNPCVRLVGGLAAVEFYTSDTPVRYLLSIEGVTSNGRIIRERRVLDLEAK